MTAIIKKDSMFVKVGNFKDCLNLFCTSIYYSLIELVTFFSDKDGIHSCRGHSNLSVPGDKQPLQ